MKPGRDLDILVAEKVMGLKVVRSGKNGNIISTGEPGYYDVHGSLELFNPVPEYSASMSSAWEVIEKLIEQDVDFSLDSFRRESKITHTVYFNDTHRANSESAPHAICVAALKAVGIKI